MQGGNSTIFYSFPVVTSLIKLGLLVTTKNKRFLKIFMRGDFDISFRKNPKIVLYLKIMTKREETVSNKIHMNVPNYNLKPANVFRFR